MKDDAWTAAHYRGFEISKERYCGTVIIWVNTPDGPIDAPTMKRARGLIDAIIEENESLATL
jgi:hypothetical protein